MRRRLAAASVIVAIASLAIADERLTARERAWVAAGMPVVQAARARGLPIDIVVQPSDQPEASPIALGIADDRCHLVISMRGNPSADALAASIPAERFPAIVEAVFAHEVAHCWRWTQGVWHALPAGFADAADDDAQAREPEALAAMRREMREARREEAYADLVGLAWTGQAHPRDYAAVRDWLSRFRDDALPGDFHDTSAWLRLAQDPSAFGRESDPFRAAQPLWVRGLAVGDRDTDARAQHVSESNR
ncbi:MAG TPA: hypothetical protein VMU47_23200 [Caldimonas sp.]|nr:hypothetical protein [Caldimonas sp.]